MKLHIITIGKPKLTYAQAGWLEYYKRLARYHRLRASHIADKHNDASHLLEASGKAFIVALTKEGVQMDSQGAAEFLGKRELEGREIAFVIGGPDGLPQEFVNKADYCWSFGRLTFPHDLAMVMLLEILYRASTINSGHPYHK